MPFILLNGERTYVSMTELAVINKESEEERKRYLSSDEALRRAITESTTEKEMEERMKLMQQRKVEQQKTRVRKPVEKDITKAFVRNVKLYLKSKRILISEYEKKMNLTEGYFSRAASDVAYNMMSLDVAVAISKDIGYTVDEIVSGKFVNDLRRSELKAMIMQLQHELEEIG